MKLPPEAIDAALRGWFGLPDDDDLSLYDFSGEMREAFDRAITGAVETIIARHLIADDAVRTTDPRASRRTRHLRAKRIELYEFHGGHCYYCAAPTVLDCDATLNWAATIDHKTPLGRGGSNADDNLVLACRKCNGDKGILTAEKFAQARRPKTKKRLALVPAGGRRR